MMIGPRHAIEELFHLFESTKDLAAAIVFLSMYAARFVQVRFFYRLQRRRVSPFHLQQPGRAHRRNPTRCQANAVTGYGAVA
jgi:hypothetical protein